jgi:hydroxymethylglutaryl-CoA synthase
MERPKDIGIIAIETYIPATYVSQAELEIFYKESKGKYTIGLGQNEMACIGDREDINSISATVLLQLLESQNINPTQIGRIEIGTETIQDKSKSTKTFLMDFLAGNNSIEGVTCYNACYGGVQALFNTIAWVESSSWDGKYGIVIASDIAVYEPGPARCTGGAGAIALLIGPNSKLVLCRERSSYMEHAYDFYKPIPGSEYPVVDGQFSINCYLKAVSQCFKDLKNKTSINALQELGNYYCFHAPYYKMIRKAFSHIFIDDLKYLILRSNNQDPGLIRDLNSNSKPAIEEITKQINVVWDSKVILK